MGIFRMTMMIVHDAFSSIHGIYRIHQAGAEARICIVEVLIKGYGH